MFPDYKKGLRGKEVKIKILISRKTISGEKC